VDSGNGKARILALNELLTIYLPALKTHLLTCLHVSANHADDILQGFVAEKVIERNLLTHADQAKGRFRNFILRSFKNYVISEARRQNARKRAPDASVNIRFDEFPDLVAEKPEIERAFDISWARRVISETIRLMQKECKQKKREDVWNVFECRVVNPILNVTTL
jgi:RNA polymerase sigma-70 factor (ECF subfamily)